MNIRGRRSRSKRRGLIACGECSCSKGSSFLICCVSIGALPAQNKAPRCLLDSKAVLAMPIHIIYIMSMDTPYFNECIREPVKNVLAEFVR